MRFLINLMLFAVVAAAFVWWLRPYWGRWKRIYQTTRNAFKFVRQVRDATKSGGFRVGKTGFGDTGFGGATRANTGFGGATRDPKTVDVTAKMSIKVGCPVCKEMLSEAQLAAMRGSQLRCPAMIGYQADCPYYGRSLN